MVKKAGADPSAAASFVQVKQEPKSELEILSEKIKALQSDPKPSLRKFQDFETELSEIKVKATNDTKNKYAAMLATDVEKVFKQVTWVIKILKKLIAKEECEPKELPKLVNAIDGVCTAVDDARSWAGTFGFDVQVGPRKRRKTAKKAA